MMDFGQKEGHKLDLTMCISEPEIRPAGPRARTMCISEPASGRPPAAGRKIFFFFFIRRRLADYYSESMPASRPRGASPPRGKHL